MWRPNCYFAKMNAGISWPDAMAGGRNNSVSFLGRFFLGGGSKNRSSESRNNRKFRSYTFCLGVGWVLRPLEITLFLVTNYCSCYIVGKFWQVRMVWEPHEGRALPSFLVGKPWRIAKLLNHTHKRWIISSCWIISCLIAYEYWRKAYKTTSLFWRCLFKCQPWKMFAYFWHLLTRICFKKGDDFPTKEMN